MGWDVKVILRDCDGEIVVEGDVAFEEALYGKAEVRRVVVGGLRLRWF